MPKKLSQFAYVFEKAYWPVFVILALIGIISYTSNRDSTLAAICLLLALTYAAILSIFKLIRGRSVIARTLLVIVLLLAVIGLAISKSSTFK